MNPARVKGGRILNTARHELKLLSLELSDDNPFQVAQVQIMNATERKPIAYRAAENGRPGFKTPKSVNKRKREEIRFKFSSDSQVRIPPFDNS